MITRKIIFGLFFVCALVLLTLSLAVVKNPQTISQQASSLPLTVINETQSLPAGSPIYKLTISGQATFLHEISFLRIILVDKNKDEYLVYETSPLLSDKTSFSFDNSCEETCLLEGIAPDHLRIEGFGTSYRLGEVSSEEKLDSQVSLAGIPRQREQIKKEIDAQKIQTINKQIETKGLKWVAGETTVSQMTYAQKKKLFPKPEGTAVDSLPNLQGFEYYTGGIFEIKSEKDSPSSLSSPVSPATLPSSWDWRNVHGENWMTPVRDQGSCGSCWAFGALGSVEAGINLHYNQHLDVDLSEQDVVCSYPGSCYWGGNVLLSFLHLRDRGLVTEQCLPYRAVDSGPECQKCLDWQSKLWKITDFGTFPSNVDDNEFKQSIIQNGPMAFAVYTWQHAVVAVGYETGGFPSYTFWIIKNSWGRGWGEGGYGRIIAGPDNRFHLSYAKAPYFFPKIDQYQIACIDKDNDNYCNWGISAAKPMSCPASCRAQKDCDDANPNLGPFDRNFACVPLASPTPTPELINYVDQPQQNGFYSSTFDEFSGWTIWNSGRRVEKVEFYMDLPKGQVGKYSEALTDQFERQDLCTLNPLYCWAGWRWRFDSSWVDNGWHKLYVYAYDADQGYVGSPVVRDFLVAVPPVVLNLPTCSDYQFSYRSGSRTLSISYNFSGNSSSSAKLKTRIWYKPVVGGGWTMLSEVNRRGDAIGSNTFTVSTLPRGKYYTSAGIVAYQDLNNNDSIDANEPKMACDANTCRNCSNVLVYIM